MKLIVAIVFICISSFSFSQEVKLKKGIVYIDGIECMKYDVDTNFTTFSNMNGEEIMYIQYVKPETAGIEIYTKVGFTATEEYFTTVSFLYWKKDLIVNLLKSNAIVDCKLVPEKLKHFILKNDEKVEERLKPNSTIIIKEEPRKSGININIGN